MWCAAGEGWEMSGGGRGNGGTDGRGHFGGWGLIVVALAAGAALGLLLLVAALVAWWMRPLFL